MVEPFSNAGTKRPPFLTGFAEGVFLACSYRFEKGAQSRMMMGNHEHGEEVMAETQQKKHHRKTVPIEVQQTMERLLNQQWVLLEQDSPLPLQLENYFVVVDDTTRIIQLRYLNHAIGVLRGSITDVEDPPRQGMFICGDTKLRLQDHRPKILWRDVPLPTVVDTPMHFKFWPTWHRRFPVERFPDEQTVYFPYLRLSGIYKLPNLPDNYFEVTGRLEQIGASGFELSLYSLVRKRFYYVYLEGVCPYPEKKGEYLSVHGRFDLTKSTLVAEHVQPVTFLPPEKAQQVLKTFEAT